MKKIIKVIQNIEYKIKTYSSFGSEQANSKKVAIVDNIRHGPWPMDKFLSSPAQFALRIS